ncbi:MAG: CopG family transcriptional regulator [Lactococcus lactis]
MSEKKRLTISLSDNIFKYLESVSKEKGLSKSAMITVALENYRKVEK